MKLSIFFAAAMVACGSATDMQKAKLVKQAILARMETMQDSEIASIAKLATGKGSSSSSTQSSSGSSGGSSGSDDCVSIVNGNKQNKDPASGIVWDCLLKIRICA